MCESGSRSTSRIGLIPEVHGCDKTVVHSEDVENFAVRKNIALEIPDKLVHPDADSASVFLGDGQRFDMAIELAPLSSPISADLFLSDNPAAL